MRTAPNTLGALALVLALLHAPALMAAAFSCVLTDMACAMLCEETRVSFAIEPAQFVDPISPNDPPRRQTTQVAMNDARFVAQAIMMPGGVFGFHEDAGELGRRLMIVRADGSARLSLRPSNVTLTGTCTRS